MFVSPQHPQGFGKEPTAGHYAPTEDVKFTDVETRIGEVTKALDEATDIKNILILLFQLAQLRDHKQKANTREIADKDTHSILDLGKEIKKSYNDYHSVVPVLGNWCPHVTNSRMVATTLVTNLAFAVVSPFTGNPQAWSQIGNLVSSMLQSPSQLLQQQEEALRSVLNTLKSTLEAEKQRLGQETQPDQAKAQQIDQLLQQINGVISKIWQ